MKIVKSLEDSGILLKENSKTVQNEVKEQKEGFLGMLLGTLVASVSRNMLTGWGTKKAREGIARAGYGHHSKNKRNKMDF